MQRHSVTLLENARSLANGPIVAGGWEGICREMQRLLSLFFVYGSTGGVCGQSLTAGKILFTGRQTCSLYLVLWLCDYSTRWAVYSKCIFLFWELVSTIYCVGIILWFWKMRKEYARNFWALVAFQMRFRQYWGKKNSDFAYFWQIYYFKKGLVAFPMRFRQFSVKQGIPIFWFSPLISPIFESFWLISFDELLPLGLLPLPKTPDSPRVPHCCFL